MSVQFFWVLPLLLSFVSTDLLAAAKPPSSDDPYLRSGNARGAALGLAMQPILNGADAVFANPAGLSSLQAVETGLQHESWANGTFQDSLFIAAPLSARSGLGLKGFLADLGNEPVLNASGQVQGQRPSQRYGVDLSLGLRQGAFAGGADLRVLRQTNAREDRFGLGAGLGLAWNGGQGFGMGLSVANLGSSQLGPGYEVLRWSLGRRWYQRHGWIWPALGFSFGAQDVTRLHLGVEWRLDQVLDLRLGYQGAFDNSLFSSGDGLGFGLGSRWGPFSLDYACFPLPGRQVGQRLGLSWRPEPRRAGHPLPSSLPPPPVPQVPARITVAEDPLESAFQLEEAGKLELAVERYAQVAQDYPGLLGAWRGLADLNYRLGRHARALEAYAKVQRLKPSPELAAWLQAYKESLQGP